MDYFGKIYIALGLFYDDLFEQKFDSKQELNDALRTIVKVSNLVYAQDVWKKVADIEVVVTHVAKADISIGSGHAGHFLTNFEAYLKGGKMTNLNNKWRVAQILTA